MLTYPVGLITLDEAVFAGGLYNSSNTSYYLRTGSSYLTMSPYLYDSTSSLAHVGYINANGSLYYFNTRHTSTKYGLRPVINLKPGVMYASGSGSETDPYIVTIQ